MAIRIVVADDHPIVLDGLNRLFEAEVDAEVVASCSDGEDSLLAIRRERPDIAVLDLSMPKMNGLEVARRVHQEKLPTRCVLLTAALREDQLIEAMRLGVKGIVLKEMAPSLLVQCVRAVQAGRQWIEKNIGGQTLATLLARRDDAQRGIHMLTTRESELTRLVSRGLSNKEIAKNLAITEGTVKIHLSRIYEKLGIHNRVELSNLARNEGLV